MTTEEIWRNAPGWAMYHTISGHGGGAYWDTDPTPCKSTWHGKPGYRGAQDYNTHDLTNRDWKETKTKRP